MGQNLLMVAWWQVLWVSRYALWLIVTINEGALHDSG